MTTPEMRAYSAVGGEVERLSRGIGPLEFARTRSDCARLPAPPPVISDISGADMRVMMHENPGGPVNAPRGIPLSLRGRRWVHFVNDRLINGVWRCSADFAHIYHE